MSRYLDDAEAERSLKKGFHVVFESRARILALRINPPFGPVPVVDGWHPLDRFIADDLLAEGLCPTRLPTPIPLWSRIALAVSPFAWGVVFLSSALSTLIRRSGNLMEIRSLFASHKFLRPHVFSTFCRYVTEKDSTLPPLTIISGKPDGEPISPDTARTVAPHCLPVPFRRWVRDVIFPGITLFGAVIRIVVCSRGDARVLTAAAIAMRQAFSSLSIWKVAYNVRFLYFLDVVEYNEQHILKGIIFRKFGAGVVRWPASAIDSPGTVTSFLGYDIFLSPGAYQAETYRKTWHPGSRSISVGLLHKDPRFGTGTDVSEYYRRTIERKRSAGKRMIVLFGSSNAAPESFGLVMAEMLNAAKHAIGSRDDYFFVIKPKGRKGEYLHHVLENDPRLKKWIREADVISVHYDVDDVEVCGSGWLIEHMAIGIGNSGTVMTEALSHGRPYYAYYPAIAPTQLTDRMSASGFLHSDVNSFRECLAAAISDPGAVDIPVDWIRENFDPYDDEKALERILDILIQKPSAGNDRRSSSPGFSNETKLQPAIWPVKEHANG